MHCSPFPRRLFSFQRQADALFPNRLARSLAADELPSEFAKEVEPEIIAKGMVKAENREKKGRSCENKGVWVLEDYRLLRLQHPSTRNAHTHDCEFEPRAVTVP